MLTSYLSAGFVALVTGTIFVVVIIAAGLSDPRPVGTLQERSSLQQVSFSNTPAIVPALSCPQTEETFTIRATFAPPKTQSEYAYGVGITTNDKRVATVLILGGGYISFQGPDSVSILPAQRFPHLSPHGDQVNEIWIEVVDGYVGEIRLNRERLWLGKHLIPLNQCTIGVYVEADSATRLQLRILSFELFY